MTILIVMRFIGGPRNGEVDKRPYRHRIVCEVAEEAAGLKAGGYRERVLNKDGEWILSWADTPRKQAFKF